MKFRITEITIPDDGVSYFRIYYKRPRPTGTAVESEWIYWAWRSTEGDARALVAYAIKPVVEESERIIEEFDSENKI